MKPSQQHSINERPADGIPIASRPRANVVSGAIWMIAITLGLFFIPLINGIIGGFVGGYKVGSVKRALTAAVLPAIAASVGLWIILAMFELPVIGLIAGVTTLVVVLLSDIGIFIGAALGGKMSQGAYHT